MTYQNYPRSIFKWSLILCVLLFSEHTYSQCAGANNTVTVCHKDQDASTRTYDLSANLNGTPAPGGRWTTDNPANFFAFDRNTGIVDLWRINTFGEHRFTYTNSACDQSATVTVILGGYPGENNIDGSANACSDDSMVNLHGFLGSEVDGKVQDFNGIWAEVPAGATGFLEANIFDAQSAGPGIYNFTYTVPDVDSCPGRQARVILEVHPAADPGIPTPLVVCTNDDLSAYTNFDLNDRLSGEDPNGTWSEQGTNQLNGLSDSVINVEEINDNFGYGIYPFTYTVFPSHPVCEKRSAIVNMVILPVLDGHMTVPNYCQGSDLTVNLDYDKSIMPNGSYAISYRINNGTAQPAPSQLIDGSATFDIDPSLVPLNRFVTVDIVGITGVSPLRDVCPDILVPQTSFLVSDATIAAADSCRDTSNIISLSNILDTTAHFSDNSYTIQYSLTDSEGTVHNSSIEGVKFTDGNGTFTLNAELLGVPGEYRIFAEAVGSFDIDCNLETTFEVVPIPDAIELGLLVDNTCNATRIDVRVDAPNLADGTYAITYDVTRQDTGEVVIDNSINFAGGTASYDLDVASLEQGNYTVSVRSSQNDTTPCRLEFDFEEKENFAIDGIPALPEAEAQQTFCLSTFAPDSPTLADIAVSANGQILFYATATDMDILPINEVLVDGEDYFISNIDPNNNCEGTNRVQVSVSLADPEIPTALNPNPVFCGSENSTIGDLNASVTATGNIVWFETASGGTVLESSVKLINDKSYFAATQTNGECLSHDRLEVIPTVYALEAASLQLASLALCGLDNPTVPNLKSAQSDNLYVVLWYEVAENGSPLKGDLPLISKATYYAESFNPDTGCMNPERMAVTVDLSHCDPEDYGFFIPDGFSPNGDGRNDTFFVPNVDIIFPDFTLEILNRYGATLFKGDRNRPAWDGSDGRGMAPNGVYFYILNYNKEEHEPIQGRLYLNR